MFRCRVATSSPFRAVVTNSLNLRPGITAPSRKYSGEQLVNEVDNSERETLYWLLEGRRLHFKLIVGPVLTTPMLLMWHFQQQQATIVVFSRSRLRWKRIKVISLVSTALYQIKLYICINVI